MRTTNRISLLALFALFTCNLLGGCSGITGNPVVPTEQKGISGTADNTKSERVLWGIWSISIDPGEMNAIIEPLRIGEAHFNITDMLLPPTCENCLDIQINSFDLATRILDVDVILRNPTSLPGRDIRGILYTNDYGHQLRNADAWTALWDISGGEDINPFRAFAKSEGNRIFNGGAMHMEKYLISIPKPPMWNKITCSVDASWPGNCKEPYSIDNFVQTEDINADPGSNGVVHVDVHDWQDDVDTVMILAPDLANGWQSMINTTGDTWEATLTNELGASAGTYQVEVKAVSGSAGITDLYNFFDVVLTPSTTQRWTRTWGGNNIDWSGGIALDESGNIYCTGYFWDTVDFDPGPEVEKYTSNGQCDIFISKFDSNGDLKWVRTVGGSDTDQGFGIAVDGNDNVYVTGGFRGTVDFDPGPGADERMSKGGYDMFLSKFDSSGNYHWTRTWGGTDTQEYCWGIAIDGNDNVYLTGAFGGSTDFDPGLGVDEHIAEGEAWTDIFLSKFDSNGVFQWARTWGSAEVDEGIGVTIDGNGNAYVTGWFRETVDFDPGVGVENHYSNGEYDVFLSKFDQDGGFLWARDWGGSSWEIGLGIDLDGTGNVYLTGRFCQTVDFNPGSLTDLHTSNGDYDIFLSKFDPDGNFKFARTWGGPSEDTGGSIVIDESDNIYITGNFQDIVDFDPGFEEAESASNGQSDIFLSKFDSFGSFNWAHTWGGLESDGGHTVAIDGSGNICISGVFMSTVDFDTGPGLDEHISNGEFDICLSKFPPE